MSSLKSLIINLMVTMSKTKLICIISEWETMCWDIPLTFYTSLVVNSYIGCFNNNIHYLLDQWSELITIYTKKVLFKFKEMYEIINKSNKNYPIILKILNWHCYYLFFIWKTVSTSLVKSIINVVNCEFVKAWQEKNISR